MVDSNYLDSFAILVKSKTKLLIEKIEKFSIKKTSPLLFDLLSPILIMPLFSSNLFLIDELRIEDGSRLFLIFSMIHWSSQNLIRPDTASWKSFVLTDSLKYLITNLISGILFFSLINISSNSFITINQVITCCTLILGIQTIPRFLFNLYSNKEKILCFFDFDSESKIIIGSSDKIKSHLIQFPKTPNTYCINNLIDYGNSIFGIKSIGNVENISSSYEHLKQLKKNNIKVVYIKSDFSDKDQKTIESELRKKKVSFQTI
jgi:FlaA1/EpsC-like NDP-sugar epimerase